MVEKVRPNFLLGTVKWLYIVCQEIPTTVSYNNKQSLGHGSTVHTSIIHDQLLVTDVLVKC